MSVAILKDGINAEKSKASLLSRADKYKSTLKEIGCDLSMEDIIKDSKTLQTILRRLETKNLTTTEVYVELKKYLKAEAKAADNYNMATKNLTEEEYNEAKRQ